MGKEDRASVLGNCLSLEAKAPVCLLHHHQRVQGPRLGAARRAQNVLGLTP